jgi:hypothetical protein
MLPLCGALLLSLCGGWLGLRLLKGKACSASLVSDGWRLSGSAGEGACRTRENAAC